MSQNSMASCSSSSSREYERPNAESIRAVVASINTHIHEFLANDKTWKSVKLKCTSKLKIQQREFFEFSEHSVLSNLYWGIENIEAAIQSKQPEEKSGRLKNSERMLQVPALLNELGVTAGISNQYLICCSYFYLSVVRKLQGDEWQVALDFLQAVLVSPQLFWTEFTPKPCNSSFIAYMTFERQKMGAKRSLNLASLMDCNDDEIVKAMRHMARRYKAWLTYYQVMTYGEAPQCHAAGTDTASANEELQFCKNRKSTGTAPTNLKERGKSLLTHYSFEKVHPLGPQEHVSHNVEEESKVSDIMQIQEHTEALTDVDQVHADKLKIRSNIRHLQDLLTESKSDTPIAEDANSSGSADEDKHEVYDDEITTDRIMINAGNQGPETYDCITNRKQVAHSSTRHQVHTISLPQPPRNLANEETNEGCTITCYSERYHRSFSDLESSILEFRNMDSCRLGTCHVEEGTRGRKLHHCDLQSFNHLTTAAVENNFTIINCQGTIGRNKQNPYSIDNINEVCLLPGKGSEAELMGILERAISSLCFSEGSGTCDEDYTIEVVKTYEMLSSKRGIKYTLLKDIILDQLLAAISTSKEVGVIKASVTILSTLVARNKKVIKDINKNGLQLCNLAGALKRNVHEAVILIYLINPPPSEIKTLELLPTLVEVVCTSSRYKGRLAPVLPTPPVASLMIIEVLVTAFDYATNNMHLAAISSPRVLSGLLDVPRNNNLEDFTSLATIFVRCMQFDGQCRKYISTSAPMAPFISLLLSSQKQAKFIALEFFHEMLCMPRSLATNLLQQIQKEGSTNNLQTLLLLIQQSQPKYKLLAANLLLQLDILEDPQDQSTYRDEAVQVLLKSLTDEENSDTQQLSAFLLSNLGGTYTWTGEPCTVAWLLKKTGLTSQQHRNMIRSINWLDQTLQDPGVDTWCSKIARTVAKIGTPIFHALVRGLSSKKEKVSRDCLTAIAWIGCEIAKIPDNLRYSASEILLSAVDQFLHPGSELEDRLLACLCIYNYASGKGMQKLIHFSEGVRESLRRLSNITWMAEELLRVADYFRPNKWRISCVHTQILEATYKYSGAVTALVYYKGQLCSGYADGSIKVWDINRQTATLVLDMKEHKKAVTCFSLFEQGDCLLSGSADKTIRMWQMIQRKLECIEVIGMKEPLQSLDTDGQLIFAVTKSYEMKVFDASRTIRDQCRAKHVKCVRVIHGKAYLGCTDSSIKELSITNNREREMKAPSKIWRMQSRAINAIVVYKNWLYSASAVVEGSDIKEWRRKSKPQMSIVPDRGTNVLAMEVVEDFIYLKCSSSPSILQIWLKGTQQKVGRLSAGSKITSLLAGNDTILCGTETGLIKGWIPL